MDIPEAILDKLDIVYEDDGKTPKAVKVKGILSVKIISFTTSRS